MIIKEINCYVYFLFLSMIVIINWHNSVDVAGKNKTILYQKKSYVMVEIRVSRDRTK